MSVRNFLLALCCISFCQLFAQQDRGTSLHRLALKSISELDSFLEYRPGMPTLISAHRGGVNPGHTENTIGNFAATLTNTWAFIELDPRWTKDSALVIMHDPTLERVSFRKDSLNQLSYQELLQIRLKDAAGNPAPDTVPLLTDVMVWAKEKTILILDQKNVPALQRAQCIQHHESSAHVLLMAYSYADARAVHRLYPSIRFEVFITSIAQAKQFEESGIPWSNIIAFVGHTVPVENELIPFLHSKKVMCIVGSSRNFDKEFQEGRIDQQQLYAGYQSIIKAGADIIETDLPVELAGYLNSFQ